MAASSPQPIPSHRFVQRLNGATIQMTRLPRAVLPEVNNQGRIDRNTRRYPHGLFRCHVVCAVLVDAALVSAASGTGRTPQ